VASLEPNLHSGEFLDTQYNDNVHNTNVTRPTLFLYVAFQSLIQWNPVLVGESEVFYLANKKLLLHVWEHHKILLLELLSKQYLLNKFKLLKYLQRERRKTFQLVKELFSVLNMIIGSKVWPTDDQYLQSNSSRGQTKEDNKKVL
jgi:hypothetical protein